MANSRKSGPVRQFSLQSDTPNTQQQRRSSLRKQHSGDFFDDEEKCANIRISMSVKARVGVHDKTPSVKPAWNEFHNQGKTDNGDSYQFFENTDSLLGSRQELADKARLALARHDYSKPNLEIYVDDNKYKRFEIVKCVPSSETKVLTNVPNEQSRSLSGETKTTSMKFPVDFTPKIISPLKPNVDNENLKTAFQKHLRKTAKQGNDLLSSPRVATGATIVVTLKQQTHPKLGENRKFSHHNSFKVEKSDAKNGRASTATSRREMFQNRTNSAFHGNTKKETKPPLIRASSLPLKSEPQKLKLVAEKRKIKSAKYGFVKTSESAREEESKDASMKGCLRRSASVAGDVVTMVSLVSPEGSDAEEQPSENKEETRQNDVAGKERYVKMNKIREDKNFTLRKIAKSGEYN